MGQIKVIRCFVQNFYMVASRLGSVPSARVRIVVSVILSVVEACQTAPRLSALPVLVYSFGGGVGIVVLADSRRQVLPGRPVPSLFKLRQGV